jgi:hypothetical protein
MTIDTAALRELCERATPGPWEYGIDPCHFDSPEVRNNRWAIYVPTDEDAAFIAAARTALPELLDRVEKLENVAEEASELLEACGALRHLGRLTNKDTGKRLVEVRAHKDVADFVEANYADIDFFIQKLQKALRDAGLGSEDHRQKGVASWL